MIKFECPGPGQQRIAFRHGGSCPVKGSGFVGVASNGPVIEIWIAGHLEYGSTDFHGTLAHEAVHAATFILTLHDLRDVEALPRTVDQLVEAVLRKYKSDVAAPRLGGYTLYLRQLTFTHGGEPPFPNRELAVMRHTYRSLGLKCVDVWITGEAEFGSSRFRDILADVAADAARLTGHDPADLVHEITRKYGRDPFDFLHEEM